MDVNYWQGITCMLCLGGKVAALAASVSQLVLYQQVIAVVYVGNNVSSSVSIQDFTWKDLYTGKQLVLLDAAVDYDIRIRGLDKLSNRKSSVDPQTFNLQNPFSAACAWKQSISDTAMKLCDGDMCNPISSPPKWTMG